MKLRTGFVSNSSSSSFCILGVIIPSEIITELTEKGSDIYELEEKTDLDVAEGLDVYSGEHFIGLTPDAMADDETLLEFKERILKKLKKLNLTVTLKDIQWYADGGYC